MPKDSQKKIDIAPDGWKVLGVGSVIFSTICLIGVVAVVSLKSADELASVALVLAIAAFVVQIIVSALQNAASRSAESASQRLNSETNTVLEQIKASAVANQDILARQFDTLLDALIQRGRSKDDDSDGSASESDFIQGRPAVDRVENQWVPSLLRSDRPSGEDERMIQHLRSFPSEEDARRLLPRLQALSPTAVAMLDRYARDEITSRQSGREVGLLRSTAPLASANFDELRTAGLVEVDGDDDQNSRLTDEGREVVRLLKARDVPPPAIAEAFGIPRVEDGSQ
jgi:hypothetical protein